MILRDNFLKLGLKVLEIVFHVSAVKHLFQRIRDGRRAELREGQGLMNRRAAKTIRLKLPSIFCLSVGYYLPEINLEDS
jgi:hypothetical protein